MELSSVWNIIKNANATEKKNFSNEKKKYNAIQKIFDYSFKKLHTIKRSINSFEKVLEKFRLLDAVRRAASAKQRKLFYQMPILYVFSGNI